MTRLERRSIRHAADQTGARSEHPIGEQSLQNAKSVHETLQMVTKPSCPRDGRTKYDMSSYLSSCILGIMKLFIAERQEGSEYLFKMSSLLYSVIFKFSKLVLTLAGRIIALGVGNLQRADSEAVLVETAEPIHCDTESGRHRLLIFCFEI
jgi:hypothetical protein